MTNQPVQNATSGNGVMPILLPCLLIGHFLWNLLTPAHEFRLSHDGWWTGHLTYSLPPR